MTSNSSQPARSIWQAMDDRHGTDLGLYLLALTGWTNVLKNEIARVTGGRLLPRNTSTSSCRPSRC